LHIASFGGAARVVTGFSASRKAVESTTDFFVFFFRIPWGKSEGDQQFGQKMALDGLTNQFKVPPFFLEKAHFRNGHSG